MYRHVVQLQVISEEKKSVNMQLEQKFLRGVELMNEEAIKECIKEGVNVNRRCLSSTPLHKAVSAGHVDIVRLLLQANANCNTYDSSRQTPLHTAAASPSPIMKLLIEANANCNVRNQSKHTPLHTAVHSNLAQNVRLLVEAKADLNNCICAYQYDETALHMAVRGNSIEIVNILFEAGANPNIKNKYNGETALHIAVKGARIEMTKALCNVGAETNIQNMEGHVPLFYAFLEHNVEIIALLLKAGAIAPLAANFVRAVMAAVTVNDINFLRTLVLHRVDMNFTNHMGYTPLHVAVQNENKSLVELFVNAGANLSASNNVAKVTPLDVSLQRNLKEITTILKCAQDGA